MRSLLFGLAALTALTTVVLANGISDANAGLELLN